MQRFGSSNRISERLILKEHDGDYYCNVNVFSSILVTHILICKEPTLSYLKKNDSVNVVKYLN